MSWTSDKILALAPDAASAKSSRGLAHLHQWQALGHADGVLWGQCQGSGSKPYQTRIDTREPAFRCSCPSRKFPCKHGLALFLLYAEEVSAFPDSEPPVWVQDWLTKRQARSEQQQQKREAVPPVDAAAQAKRSAARQAKVDAGVAELQQWLNDLLRRGLVTAQEQSYGLWDSVAARMVDAQAPGLARRLQRMGSAVHSGTGWESRVLAQLGQLQLILAGYGRLAQLPVGLQADVRSQMGWTLTQDEVLAQAEVNVSDRWWVLGQREEQEERLRVRRIWLRGERTGTWALLLGFAHGSQPFELNLLPGTKLEAELAFFPSAYPLRAVIRDRYGASAHGAAPDCAQGLPAPVALEAAGQADSDMPQGVAIAAVLERYSHALGQNPWLERLPLVLGDVVPMRQPGEDRWLVRDAAGHGLAIASTYAKTWELRSLSGGHPMQLAGEWDGQSIWPLAAWITRDPSQVGEAGDRTEFVPL